LRAKQKRNFLTTLLVSQGVPMLLAGDELGRTQQGNNNTYCQDSELTWLNWELERDDQELFEFVCYLIHLRKQHPILRRRHFFQGREIVGTGVKDITWLTPDGKEMTDKHWHQSFARCLGVFLAGKAIDEFDERGQRITDVNMILLLNAHHEAVHFNIPEQPAHARWQVLVDTSFPAGKRTDGRFFSSNSTYSLQKRSCVLLKHLKKSLDTVN